ncbi:MAG TPA: DUF2889 domain-containing protein [Methylomirabilota bacterium]|nr:DUF2889 domain-containing protein [Methylomirabilota bacterium]
MTIACRFLERDDPYERTVTAWVDSCEDALLKLTARLVDPAVDLEVSLLAEPSPSYHVARATAAARSDATRHACEAALARFGGLGGRRIVAGFRREAAAVLGETPGADYLLDAAIEAARLSRQVTRTTLPAGAPLEPADFHEVDLRAWPELVDLCFTYRAETRALFAERAVRSPAVPDMYAAPPGRPLVFHRYKRTQVGRAGPALSLYQSMFDQVHGFELWYDLDLATHEVLRARALTPRLPYMGICDEPQRRVRDMEGVRLGADWTGEVRRRLGGRQGCFQLTDLTSDLFRLLTVR